MRLTTMKIATVTAAAAGAIALAAPAASAAAPAASTQATAGVFTLCNHAPGYESYAVFLPGGGKAGFIGQIVADGHCWSVSVGGSANRQVNVRAQYPNGKTELIGSTIYNGSDGEKLITVAGPGFYRA